MDKQHNWQNDICLTCGCKKKKGLGTVKNGKIIQEGYMKYSIGGNVWSEKPVECISK
jgi:hypothetical protein